ncbi:hypothetical protein [Millisia brevis]|uniref:hypothetical protein n=1 Tax=Millisia brevis TaxID=264148 RepID=UPI000830F296|nr:hypothetical protein [Millisia brevis]
MRFVMLGMLVCVLAGCAANATSNQDSGTAAMALNDGLSTNGGPDTVEPTRVPADNVGTIIGVGQLVDDRTVPFSSWSELAGNQIAIHFTSGSPACFGADAGVQETPSTVTITVRTGRLATALDHPCLMVASYSTLVVNLSQPVGDREVLSGR